MNTKQQLDEIQKAIDAIRENLGLNPPEKPNGCEQYELPDYTHLLPEGYEFCQEQEIRIHPDGTRDTTYIYTE